MNQEPGVLELPLFAALPDDPNVDWLVATLEREADWLTGRELAERADWTWNENTRRKLRALVHATAGRVIGSQRGYKLVHRLTKKEFDHWRNARLKEAKEAQADVLAADKIFYGRAAVN